MIRTGIVSTVDVAERTIRVTYPDKDDLVSGELPIIGPAMIGLPPVDLPEIGQMVLIGYPENSTDGYCLGIIPGGGT